HVFIHQALCIVSVRNAIGACWSCCIWQAVANGWNSGSPAGHTGLALFPSEPRLAPVDVSRGGNSGYHSKSSGLGPEIEAWTRKRSVMKRAPRTQTPVKPPRFAEQSRMVLPGSEKAPAPNAVRVKATPARSLVTVSVIVKRKEPLKVNQRGGRASGPARVGLTEYKNHHGGDPDAIKLVKAFAREFNLKVEKDPTAAVRRTVKLTGTAADIQKAFGVVLEQKMIDGAEYRVREGGIQLPASLAGVVEAVLGLDNRPQAQPHFRVCKALAKTAAPASYTPPQVAQAYNFPATASGAGQTIGIIELGGGYRQADLTAYFKSLGLAPAGDHSRRCGRGDEQAVDGQQRGRGGDAGH